MQRQRNVKKDNAPEPRGGAAALVCPNADRAARFPADGGIIMEVMVRIAGKSQIIIPQDTRKKTGMLPHAEVVFEYVRGNVILEPAGNPAKHADRSARTRKRACSRSPLEQLAMRQI